MQDETHQIKQFLETLGDFNLRLWSSSGPYLPPPFIARGLAMLYTAIYDTWTCYTPGPDVASIYNGLPRRVLKDLKSFYIAMRFASIRILEHVFETRPLQIQQIHSFFSQEEINFLWPDQSIPAGVGNLIADKIIKYRTSDGSNCYNQIPGSPVGSSAMYQDWTNFFPVNNAQEAIARTDPAKLRSINKWEPLKVWDPKSESGFKVQKCAAPHAGKVLPFAVKVADFHSQWPLGPSAMNTSTEADMRSQIQEIMTIYANLRDDQKAMAEYWADGPDSDGPPGHWNRFVLNAIRSANLTIEQTIKLLFLQSNAVLDAGIVAWSMKMTWNNARPITMIQASRYYELIISWQGPYLGCSYMYGPNWIPYQKSTFLTPAFPDYVSGHSTFSASSAEILKLFFGNDTFIGNNTVIMREGQSLIEPKIVFGQPGYIAGLTDVPNQGPQTIGYSPAKDIVLSWKTWSEAAEEAGISRLFGGIHFQKANQDGQAMGRKVGQQVYLKAQALFNGNLNEQVHGSDTIYDL